MIQWFTYKFQSAQFNRYLGDSPRLQIVDGMNIFLLHSVDNHIVKLSMGQVQAATPICAAYMASSILENVGQTSNILQAQYPGDNRWKSRDSFLDLQTQKLDLTSTTITIHHPLRLTKYISPILFQKWSTKKTN